MVVSSSSSSLPPSYLVLLVLPSTFFIWHPSYAYLLNNFRRTASLRWFFPLPMLLPNFLYSKARHAISFNLLVFIFSSCISCSFFYSFLYTLYLSCIYILLCKSLQVCFFCDCGRINTQAALLRCTLFFFNSSYGISWMDRSLKKKFQLESVIPELPYDCREGVSAWNPFHKPNIHKASCRCVQTDVHCGYLYCWMLFRRPAISMEKKWVRHISANN